MDDALRATEDASDWLIDGNGQSNSHVVLHDCMMTDALLDNSPIMAKHSHCTTKGSRESLDAIDMDEDSSQSGTCKLIIDEVTCDRTSNMEMISITDDPISVKNGPMCDQEYVLTSFCPPSPISAIDETSIQHYGKDSSDALRATEDASDWLIGGNGQSNPHVVLHDCMMTDALLDNSPIMAKHSHCTTNWSRESLDAIDMDEDSSQSGTCKLIIDEVTCDRTSNMEMISITDDPISVKNGPMCDQEYVLTSFCPPSPISAIDETSIQHYGKVQKTCYKEPTPVVSNSRAFLNQPHRLIVPNFGLKMDETAGLTLPRMLPSSTSSESEGGNVSPQDRSSPTRRLFLSSSSTSSSSSTTARSWEPIQTPLISCQPKGSTGALTLTDEEKRTLLAEGYPVPTKLPLTKDEEKSLKKIRRKIRNKISAERSRRKKKEYTDSLERKVKILMSENNDYKKKIMNLKTNNGSLDQQLQKLQKLIEQQATQISQLQKIK